MNNWPPKVKPMDRARKFKATIWVLNIGGAILVDSEREIGDSSSSPIVTASSTNAKMMIGIGVPEEM